MTSLHMKGYILRLLHDRGEMWDYEIADAVMLEYGYEGEYWYATVRMTLTDLYSGGLLDEIETTVDPSKSFGRERVLFKFALSDFGNERAKQSGLLNARV